VELVGFKDISEIHKGKINYIGKSKNLYSRIYTHRSLYNKRRKGSPAPDWIPVKGMKFDEVWVRACHVDLLDKLEYEMINLYKPKYNEALKNGLKVATPIVLRINGATVTLNEPKAQLERRI
jgi:excinuclease UvrABC nuclease subunit